MTLSKHAQKFRLFTNLRPFWCTFDSGKGSPVGSCTLLLLFFLLLLLVSCNTHTRAFFLSSAFRSQPPLLAINKIARLCVVFVFLAASKRVCLYLCEPSREAGCCCCCCKFTPLSKRKVHAKNSYLVFFLSQLAPTDKMFQSCSFDNFCVDGSLPPSFLTS